MKSRASVVIVSPYVTLKRVRWLGSLLAEVLRRGVAVIVYTRPPEALKARNGQLAKSAIDALQAMGVEVRCREGIHQKYAIMDERVVWYGSVNLLSFGASQESIMRLVSGSVARALEMDKRNIQQH